VKGKKEQDEAFEIQLSLVLFVSFQVRFADRQIASRSADKV